MEIILHYKSDSRNKNAFILQEFSQRQTRTYLKKAQTQLVNEDWVFALTLISRKIIPEREGRKLPQTTRVSKSFRSRRIVVLFQKCYTTNPHILLLLNVNHYFYHYIIIIFLQQKKQRYRQQKFLLLIEDFWPVIYVD